MLMKEEVVALDEVVALCETAADHFEKFAEPEGNPLIEAMFAGLAQLHRDEVAKLDELIRQMGELPKRPDPDRETLERAAVWLRSGFTGNRQEALLEKAAHVEQQLRQKIAGALQLQQPQEVRALLRDMQAEVESALQRIESTDRRQRIE